MNVRLPLRFNESDSFTRVWPSLPLSLKYIFLKLSLRCTIWYKWIFYFLDSSLFLYFPFCFSLDPEEDPLCTLLLMDYYCIKAEEYTYFVQLYEEYEALRQISMLPNFLYSYALALFHMERLEEADATVRFLLSIFRLLYSFLFRKTFSLPILKKNNSHSYNR